MEAMQTFSAEVRRIVECPYVPSLKPLHDVLVEHADYLQLWARGNECQIEALAQAVLEGLELWPFALNILRILSCVPSFRDEVLQRRPLLLDTLLAKATEPDSGHEKYTDVCVSLMSTPLKTAIPSRCHSFFLNLVEKLAAQSSARTIRPVYRILSGLGSQYLDDRPFEIIEGLQDQLTNALKRADEHSADLLCLAVLARLASRANCRKQSTPTRGQDRADVQQVCYPARQFFTAKRAYKTLDLVVLRAILVCSCNCPLNLVDAIESLKLSEEIVDGIDSHERESWICKNSVKNEKLYGKILRQDIDNEVQCAALNFLASLAAASRFPREIIATVESFLFTSKFSALTPKALSIYVPHLDEPSLSAHIPALLRLACCEKLSSFAALVELDNALTFANALVASKDRELRRTIWQCLTKENNSDLLGQFTKHFSIRTERILSHDSMDVCPLAYIKAQKRLHQRLGVLLVIVALQPCEEENNTYASMLVELLEKQTKVADISTSCGIQHPQKRLTESARIALFEAESTPEAISVSHGWREKLRRTMSRDANFRSDSVIRIFGEVCRDLEARCHEVEHPLRQEQALSHDVREQLEMSNARITDLEAQVNDRENVLNDLKDEIARLQDQVQSAEKRRQDLMADVASINEEALRARLEAERAVKVSAESARQQDLVYIATLTGKDKMYQELSHKFVKAENFAKNLEPQMAQLKSQEATNAEIIRAGKLAMDELRDAVVVAETLAAKRQEEIGHLVESEKKLKVSHDTVAVRAQEAAASQAATISALETQIRAVTAELAEFKEEHDAHAAAKALEISRLEEQNRGIIDGLQTNLKDARAKALLTIKQRDSTVAELQSKVKKLRHEREARVKEFAEAQVLSSRLMAIVGIKNNQSMLPIGDNKASMDYQSGSEDEAADTPHSDANISGCFDPTTPTPKRTRKRRVLKGSVFSSKEDGRVGATARESRRRTPLHDLEPMKHQNKLPQAQLNSCKERSILHEITSEGMRENRNGLKLDSDGEAFDDGDVFMGTEQDHLPSSTYDETTNEF